MKKEIEQEKYGGRNLFTTLFITLLIGWIFREAVQFSTDLPPGINGGYHPLQARSIRGAHTSNHNAGSIGIVLVGNFEETPTPEQIDSLHKLVKFLCQEFQIAYLAGHHDLNPTLTKCPGKYLMPFLDELAVKNNLQLFTN